MPFCVPELTRDGYSLLFRCEPGFGVGDCSWYQKADETKNCVHAKKYKTVTRCGCEAAKKRAKQKYFDAEAERLGTRY
jgi:hypothetical protein